MDLEAIAKEVMVEYQMSFGGAPYDFALEVAKRAVLAEREACANRAKAAIDQELETANGESLQQHIEDAIMERSNAE